MISRQRRSGPRVIGISVDISFIIFHAPPIDRPHIVATCRVVGVQPCAMRHATAPLRRCALSGLSSSSIIASPASLCLPFHFQPAGAARGTLVQDHPHGSPAQGVAHVAHLATLTPVPLLRVAGAALVVLS